MIRLFLMMALMIVSAGLVHGQETETPDDEEMRAKVAFDLVTTAADGFTIETKPVRGEKQVLKRIEAPLLRWSNPEAGSIHGAVFLWTVDDRPQLVASVFKWFSPHKFLDAEIHSLSEQPLVAKKGETTAWTTGNLGIKFQKVEGAPAPADSPVKRLTQMRTIVRGMIANEVGRDKVSVDLRPMEKPLHRYQSTKAGIVDGGLFAYVRATDPEVLALVEAKDEAGTLTWQVAFARMNSCNMHVKQGERMLYQVDELPWDVVFNGKQLYNIVRINDGK